MLEGSEHFDVDLDAIGVYEAEDGTFEEHLASLGELELLMLAQAIIDRQRIVQNRLSKLWQALYVLRYGLRTDGPERRPPISIMASMLFKQMRKYRDRRRSGYPNAAGTLRFEIAAEARKLNRKYLQYPPEVNELEVLAAILEHEDWINEELAELRDFKLQAEIEAKGQDLSESTHL